MTHFDIDHTGQGDQFVFHYTSSVGLAGILDSGVLRLTSFSRMNDMRESKAWNLGATSRGGYRTSPDWPNDARYVVDELWSSAFVACLTAEGRETSDDGFYSRGFGHARNWAQYGDAHKGACLVFDRHRVEQAASSKALSGMCRFGCVDYEDAQVVSLPDGTWLSIDAVELEERGGIEAIVEHWRSRYWHPLFFRKSTDWSSEREYRLLIWDRKERPEVPIVGSLRGIVVGEAFPTTEASVLSTRLSRLAFGPLRIARMDWLHGTPGAYFIGAENPEYPGFKVVQLPEDQLEPFMVPSTSP